MNIVLAPEIAKFVEDQVRCGRYDKPEDVVNGALLMLRTQHELSEDELAELRAEIAVGVEQADRGDVDDWNITDLRAEGQRLLDASRTSQPEAR